jgi:hypothetical protein
MSLGKSIQDLLKKEKYLAKWKHKLQIDKATGECL